MNYELACQLKDAGFPQGGKGTWVLPPDSIVVRHSDRVYVPSLEELIELVPKTTNDGLFSISYVAHQYWVAGYEKYALLVPECWGSTPVEAVARLWLLLNKAYETPKP
jgi:hypothetical protein